MSLRLGQIVHLRTCAKGADRAFVVVAEPRDGWVKLVYAGSSRWFVARRYAIADVIVELAENAHVQRARSWLNGDKAKPHSRAWSLAPEARNGWLCIDASGNGRDSKWETVGHVDLPRAWNAESGACW